MSLRHPETEDERFMKEAYRQALRAYRLGETPPADTTAEIRKKA